MTNLEVDKEYWFKGRYKGGQTDFPDDQEDFEEQLGKSLYEGLD